jgi:hypothetical protein
MTDNEKILLGVGSGVLIGKMGGSLGWWLVGGAAAFFIMKSPTARTAISSGAKKAYAAVTR